MAQDIRLITRHLLSAWEVGSKVTRVRWTGLSVSSTCHECWGGELAALLQLQVLYNHTTLLKSKSWEGAGQAARCDICYIVRC